MKRSRRSSRRGSYAVEVAFLLPILVAFGGGIADWGWYFSNEYKVQTAAKACARTGVGTDQDDDPTGSAELSGAATLTEEGLDPAIATIVATNAGTAPDQSLTCDVSLPFTPIVGLVPTLPNLRAIVTMRMEEQPE